MVKTEYIDVPQELLKPCELPDVSAIRTNEDLEAALISSILELRRCTLDKQAIGELR